MSASTVATAAGNRYDALSTWTRNILALVIVGGTIFAIYKGAKFVKGIKDKQDFKDTVKDTNSELVDLSKTEKPSYPDSTYSGWANSIFTMINGCDGYKNEAAIGNIIMQLRNTTDWLKLVKAFGVREVEGCWSSDYNADLPTTLKKEMTEISILNLNQLFAKRGIKNRI